MGMTKFSDANDPGFRSVSGEIRECMLLIEKTFTVSQQHEISAVGGKVLDDAARPDVLKAEDSARAASHAYTTTSSPHNSDQSQGPSCFDGAGTYVPAKHSSPYFTGRSEYLGALIEFFQPRDKDKPPSRREFLLHGIGGAGKTQICLKFAEQYAKL